jgi:hypothetical protein
VESWIGFIRMKEHATCYSYLIIRIIRILKKYKFALRWTSNRFDHRSQATLGPAIVGQITSTPGAVRRCTHIL